uniref:PH domain-containing protein n=1 Tax=Streptomyces sp. NBC_00008 TaxID=2903610 RepID=A0AAU2W231_9ACTN
MRSVARARRGTVLVVTALLLPLGGYGLAGAGLAPESTPIMLGLLSLIAGFVLLPALCEERAPFRHSSSHLIARTMTGERSLDLNRITTVRLLTTFSYGSTQRTLVVRDADGVRLGITTERSRRKLRRAIERLDANAARGAAGPRVSRAARTHLGLSPGRGLVGHTVLALLVLTVSASLYVIAVLQLGGQ